MRLSCRCGDIGSLPRHTLTVINHEPNSDWDVVSSEPTNGLWLTIFLQPEVLFPKSRNRSTVFIPHKRPQNYQTYVD